MNKKFFTYNSKWHDKNVLTAFSIRDNSVYYYNFDWPIFRYELGMETKYIPIDRGGPGPGSGPVLLALESDIKERKRRGKYVEYLKNTRTLDIVLKNNLERKAALEITRITDIREIGSLTIIRAHMRAYNDKEDGVGILKLYKKISDYDELIKKLREIMRVTKNKCADCGSLMVDDTCPKCGSKKIAKEKVKGKTSRFVIMLVGFIIALGAGITMMIAEAHNDVDLSNMMVFPIMIGLSAGIEGIKEFYALYK